MRCRRRGRRGPEPTCCARSVTRQRPCHRCRGHRWAARLGATLRPGHRTRASTSTPSARRPRRASDGRSVWLEPIAPHLTSEADPRRGGTRSLAWATDAQPDDPAPSTTVDTGGLDVLQADAAAAVAGHDRLVVVVGPAGAGKTTHARSAVDDLHAQRPAGVRCRPDGQGGPCPASVRPGCAATPSPSCSRWERSRPAAAAATTSCRPGRPSSSTRPA